jgi:hypothetical protein
LGDPCDGDDAPLLGGLMCRIFMPADQPRCPRLRSSRAVLTLRPANSIPPLQTFRHPRHPLSPLADAQIRPHPALPPHTRAPRRCATAPRADRQRIVAHVPQIRRAPAEAAFPGLPVGLAVEIEAGREDKAVGGRMEVSLAGVVVD